LKRINPDVIYEMPNQGKARTMYETLVKKLGPPHQMNGSLYSAEWLYQLEDGTPFSIHTSQPDIPYTLHNWIVCTFSHQDYKSVLKFLDIEAIK